MNMNLAAATKYVYDYVTGADNKKPDAVFSRLELHFVSDKCVPSQQLLLENKRGETFPCELVRTFKNYYIAELRVTCDQKKLSFCLKVNGRMIEDFTVVPIPFHRCVAFACSPTDSMRARTQLMSFVKHISLNRSQPLPMLLHALLFALKQPAVNFDVVLLADVL